MLQPRSCSARRRSGRCSRIYHFNRRWHGLVLGNREQTNTRIVESWDVSQCGAQYFVSPGDQLQSGIHRSRQLVRLRNWELSPLSPLCKIPYLAKTCVDRSISACRSDAPNPLCLTKIQRSCTSTSFRTSYSALCVVTRFVVGLSPNSISERS